MTTSKDGFPLKAEDGEDLLKGLKDLKVKLTENADIVQKYMEAVEKFLPGMTAMLGLTVSDFTLDKKSLIDLRNNMLEGEYSPVVYRAEKDGGKYEAAIWILREACGFSVHFAVVKNKDGQSWLYNSDRQNWEIIETEMDLSPRMEEILQSGSPESDVLEELLEVFYGDLDYYCRNLIMDHVGSLDPQKINQAVADYKKFCEDNHVSITDIYKKRPWNSNQRYYVVEMCEKDGSRKTIYIHIPSALQRRQRNVIDLIKPNNIVQKMR